MSAAALRLRASVVVIVVWVAVVVIIGAGCNVRAYLAQAELFESLRPGLIEDCCTCLSRRGSGSDLATCAEAVLIDGVPTVPPGSTCADSDGCPGTQQCVDGSCFGGGDRGFDLDDEVDPPEVPCLCQGDLATCIALLSNQGDVIVPGACIDQLDREAPCENACAGVLTFDPVQPP